MGGGSSDAASSLLALNRLWKLNLPLSALAKIGLQLGADVPFFLGGHNAWVEGVGERLTPLELPAGALRGRQTGRRPGHRAIFADPALKRNTDAAIISGFAANPYGFGHNDLQPSRKGSVPTSPRPLNGWVRKGWPAG